LARSDAGGESRREAATQRPADRNRRAGTLHARRELRRQRNHAAGGIRSAKAIISGGMLSAHVGTTHPRKLQRLTSRQRQSHSLARSDWIEKVQRVRVNVVAGARIGKKRWEEGALLAADGQDVRCLVRSATGARAQAPKSAVSELHVGDALRPDTLRGAGRGIGAAYYLIHSMGRGGPRDFAPRERAAAVGFARAAREEGIERVIYLGGLGDRPHSEHLRSRHETALLLRAAPHAGVLAA
jgi:hypothetical protein